VLASGSVTCLICNANDIVVVDWRAGEEHILASKWRFSTNSDLVRNFNQHIESDAHKACVEASRTKLASPLSSRMSEVAERQQTAMAQLFRVSAFQAKNK
jgi:hypothetical protein